jgi:hypothetical protein
MKIVDSGISLYLAPIGLEQITEKNATEEGFAEQHLLEYSFFANLFAGNYKLCVGKDNGFYPVMFPTKEQSKKVIRGRLTFPTEISKIRKGGRSSFTPSVADWILVPNADLLFCLVPYRGQEKVARIYSTDRIKPNQTVEELIDYKIGERKSLGRVRKMYDFSLAINPLGGFKLVSWK